MFISPILTQFISLCENGTNPASSCSNADTSSKEAAEEGGGALERESLVGWPAPGRAKVLGQNTLKMMLRASRCKTQGRAY